MSLNTGWPHDPEKIAREWPHDPENSHTATPQSSNNRDENVGLWIGGYYNNSATGLPIYLGGFLYNQSTPAMVLDSSGNVGIGTPSPSASLHVVGEVRRDRPANSGGFSIRWPSTGSAMTTTT